ncbi:restriction endonuclease subunit S [Klebsiella variicola]|uniref:restriction endonuclease subunit S n=1 Tax=Klebsiella variicola TaxID=244366 RepID=UPI0012AC0DB5|nr:restriction endonuclease subunit S [Klebsiella variicola]
MYKVRVLQEIDDRLDAEYYNPAALSTLKKMETKGTVTTFGNLVDEGYRVVYHGTDSINGLKDSDLLPFLSPTQIDANGSISFEDADKLPLYYKERYPKGLGKAGEILVEVKGNVSKVGIVPSAFPKNLMISGSLYKATLDPKRVDSHYVLAFLKSQHGQILKNRLTSNTIINYIAKDALYSIPVIEFKEKAQKYIGDKVRQAEQLRSWAKLLRTSVDDHLNSLNLPINEPPALLNRVSAQTMEDRLDPRPYRTHYLCLVHEIEKLPHDSISALVELASGCPVSSNDFLENSGIPLVRIRNIGFDDFIGLDTGVSQDVYQDATKYQAKDKMIVVGMDGIFRSQFFISDELPMLVNQRVAMLSPQNIRGELLTHWLNRPEGQMQLNQWAVKTTVEHTSLSDIGRVLIPRLDKSLENKLADYLLNARLAYRYAKFLTQVAKTLVEALIEGQLTEQQLIQAQQALEDGDNSLDQAILSKLSAEGYAIEGTTPLFSDVDELYRLLEDAAQDEAEE